MALIFNPPPNWPAPPTKDWIPQPGWQPDPAWGEAPEGWDFWVEESDLASAHLSHADEADRTAVPSSETEKDSAGTNSYAAVSEAIRQTLPEDQQSSPARDEATGSLRAGSAVGDTSDDAATVPLGAATQPGFTSAYPGSSAGTYANGGGPTGPGTSNGAAPYNAQPAGEQPKSKTGLIIGVIGGILLLLLALIVGLIFIIGGISYNTSTTSDSGDSWFSDGTDNSSDTGNSGSADTPVYSGSGDSTFTIEKPGGEDSVVWLEYTFTGEDKYASFNVHSLDAGGETNNSVYGSVYSPESSGSYWLDSNLYDVEDRTTQLVIEAEGDWTVTLHTPDKAPALKSEQTLTGENATAFRIDEGAEITADIGFTATDEYGGDLEISSSTGLVDDYEVTVLRTSLSPFKGSVTFPTGKQYILVEPYAGSWEIKAH